MGAVRWIASRVAQALAVLLVVTFLLYLLLDLLPGDAAERLVGPAPDLTADERAQRVEQERERLGLNRPLLVRYAEWLLGLVTGQLGRTLRGAPISQLVGDRLLISAEIVVVSVAAALLVSVLIAVGVYVSKQDWLARAVQAISSIFIIVPTFYLAFLLVLLFAVGLRWFPATGYAGWDDPGRHIAGLVLPVATVALPQIAAYLPYLLQGIGAAGRSPMAIAATARGISARRLLFVHLLPNGSLTTISLAGLVIANLLGGMLIVEYAFAIPGIGSLLIRGITDQDLQLVVTVTAVLAGAFVLMSIVTDIVYAAIDPRLRRVGR